MGEVYQVFINHRGPDTKMNLASLIYHRLKSYGVRVFLDKDEIHKGSTVSRAITRAIDSSSVHIALFSKRYAESRACLNELCWMMQRPSHDRKIIPVFCDVQPHDLKGIDRPPYGEAFEKHHRDIDAGKVKMEEIQGWKKALSDAADISGSVFKTDESDYGEILEEIVEAVLNSIKWDLLDVATYPVGLHEAAEDLKKNMNQSDLSATKIVAITGMGGLGKSTLAKYLYNVRRSDFNRSCYLPNFREKDLSSLQQKLVRDLLGDEVQIPINTSEGKSNFKDSIKGLRILVIFDDVEYDKEKIKCLRDMVNAVEPGSLVIITSRDKSILGASSANTFVYHIKPLKRKHAQELFCLHAFGQSKPVQWYETLVVEFLEICGGLPLCLEVLGEQLAAKPDKTYWEQQLESYFHQGRPLPAVAAVIDTLKVSYEALNQEEKNIFLDVGCFLVGEDTELAVQVLEGLGWHKARVALENLCSKCFLDFSTDEESEDPNPYIHPIPNVLSKGCSKVIMHEQVRELARHIARNDSTNPVRVSCSYDIQQISQLQRASIPCEIRGICIPKGQKPPPLTIKITGLRLLAVDYSIDFSSFLGLSISSEGMWSDLLWLRFSSSSLRSINTSTITISLQKLRVLELEGSVSDLEYFFERVVKGGYPAHLQEFNLQHSEETSRPQTVRISRASHMFKSSRTSDMLTRIIRVSKDLKKIDFQNNAHVSSFPIDSFNITNLRHLDLSDCTKLKRLPKSFSKCLRLQYLALRECQNLSFAPDFLGEISTLEYVDFSGCSQLIYLPKGMANQGSLRCLDLRRTNLVHLPENLELLDKLEELRIGSPYLIELPHSIGHLRGLKQLIILECPSLRDISTSIRLTGLERLVINYSGAPSFMERLVINNSGVPSLMERLVINNSGVPSHMQVEGSPSSLVDLTLINCSKLKALTNLSSLVNLKILKIFNCEELETVNVEGLKQLEEIQANSCHKLQRIGALSQLERLNCLELQIYNENGVICNDILQLLVSSQISTAKLYAITDDHKIELEKVVPRILSNFENLSVLDVPATTTFESPVKLENLHSYGAILMCFIPNRLRFRIRFEAGNNPGKYLEYGSKNGTESGMLDIFLWTEDSNLFEYQNFYNNVSVYCSSHSCGNGSDKGWIVPLERKTEGLEIFKKFLDELRLMNELTV